MFEDVIRENRVEAVVAARERLRDTLLDRDLLSLEPGKGSRLLHHFRRDLDSGDGSRAELLVADRPAAVTTPDVQNVESLQVQFRKMLQERIVSRHLVLVFHVRALQWLSMRVILRWLHRTNAEIPSSEAHGPFASVA